MFIERTSYLEELDPFPTINTIKKLVYFYTFEQVDTFKCNSFEVLEIFFKLRYFSIAKVEIHVIILMF